MVDFTLDDPKVVSISKAATNKEDLGPPRVFFLDDTWDPPDDTWDPPYDSCFPGLAMSRSIGDSILDELGVVPTPEVYARTLKAKDKFMVVASDGVWQVLSNEEVGACVTESKGDPAAACAQIYDIASERKGLDVNRGSVYDSASERWAGKEDAPYRDDITSIVLFFK
ncbi:phosphatase 2C-like domain-containing protein [Baffinella frigidus]|nr:phosphatase 2C-like domain-containing protein [Cryptophyta sp. CCMP2293]